MYFVLLDAVDEHIEKCRVLLPLAISHALTRMMAPREGAT